ncbi:nicotinate-nucleotide--dimethylbenzimidazole phosphoribosyltransferase [Nitrosomonas communis]|uniref:Nicotinate-nucleotide--dimethylbenzimidazole phosphoribosyltransferase n=1 Tax=Nitrosomonas communis TaxID=44574 RepID=A0A1I4M4M3_9PROT|nr:nicotinate-nucleotide--dimethylbenzimidazole phosphoribosyltransferase [Nitrosomonas communis]SFL98076.1 nicotinate-nucleotide--dimethylbenzimidazole phosphoribosyltransferase [Nitrosomonas communis]
MASHTSFDWLKISPAMPNEQIRHAALQHQAQLTKPPGALGRLEEIAVQLAALQHTLHPSVDHVQISIFAADHGVATENISAFPQAVTTEMIRNFTAGGAAINVLARTLSAQLEVINLGTVHSTDTLTNVRHYHLGAGTANFMHTAAMNENQLAAALNAGSTSVEQARANNQQLLIAGEMGIGNTTSATALACLLLNLPPAQVAGAGSGLDSKGIAHKINVIERALTLHRSHTHSSLEALRRVGGFEIAALTGAYIRGAQLGLPLLIDGFISTVAALTAEQICMDSRNWFIYAHQSAEPGHAHVLKALDAIPLLDLSMRLGEGSGAAVAVNLLRMACRLHNEMATFSTAHVSTRKQ